MNDTKSTLAELKVFISSPSGMDSEIQAIRDKIAELNKLTWHTHGIQVSVHNYSDLSGGMGVKP